MCAGRDFVDSRGRCHNVVRQRKKKRFHNVHET